MQYGGLLTLVADPHCQVFIKEFDRTARHGHLEFGTMPAAPEDLLEDVTYIG